jgi:L-rhamnose-H+ transport protein
VIAIAESGRDPDAYLNRHRIWQGLPALIVILAGGFTTNFLWCLFLNIKNKTGYQYLSPTVRADGPSRDQETIIESAFDAPSEEVVERIPGGKARADGVPLVANYFFSALAGTTWYFQFFFYSMGASQMGKYGFSSWTLHMASIIIFSTLWGIALSEWKGASRRTIALVTLGLAVLVASTVIVGYGNKLAGDEKSDKEKSNTEKKRVSLQIHQPNSIVKELC